MKLVLVVETKERDADGHIKSAKTLTLLECDHIIARNWQHFISKYKPVGAKAVKTASNRIVVVVDCELE